MPNYQLGHEVALLRVFEVLVQADDVAVIDLLHDLDLLVKAAEILLGRQEGKRRVERRGRVGGGTGTGVK